MRIRMVNKLKEKVKGMNGNFRKVVYSVVAAMFLGWSGWLTSGKIETDKAMRTVQNFMDKGDRWTETDALKQEISLLRLINENQGQIKILQGVSARIDKLETQLTTIGAQVQDIKLLLASHTAANP